MSGASAHAYEVRPVSQPIRCDVTVPGSKSITNRALLLAAMAQGTSRLSNVLFSDDSRHCLGCLQALGYALAVDEAARTVSVTGGAPRPGTRVQVGSAGTTARFITAMLAASEGRFTVDASAQMKARPMKPLFDALSALGTAITYLEKADHLPVELGGNLREGGEITLDITRSSQFLSALLMTGHLYRKGLTIVPQGQPKTYVDITLQMVRQFGGAATREAGGHYVVPPGPGFTAQDYAIEPDVSSACYFYAMAALTGGDVRVKGVRPDAMQGDVQFLDVLRQMGCRISTEPEGVRVCGPADGPLRALDIDLHDFSDQTMTLAALAIFADGPTHIRNVGHIRHQESDRLHAIATELARLGIRCDERPDGLTIYPGPPRPALVETYHDHRMAMAFALVGLRSPGIVIANPACAGKTFEGYFDLLEEVRLSQAGASQKS